MNLAIDACPAKYPDGLSDEECAACGFSKPPPPPPGMEHLADMTGEELVEELKRSLEAEDRANPRLAEARRHAKQRH
jgi:hypothetical protein